MIIVIVLCVIGVAVAVYKVSSDYPWDGLWERLAFMVLISLTAVMICGLIGTGIAFGIGQLIPKEIATTQTELISLRHDSETQGHFFLGSGSIDGKPTYFFYKEHRDGFTADTVPIGDNVIIFEEERENGTLVTHIENLSWGKELAFYSPQYSYEFHIPGGSILREFNLQ